ncbi:MAG: efflux transporter outer membrane subunit [Thermomonas sp.]|uniref:efflux transporter outer membrane subunit n=1 Tax=Thermomonas sp. TaxID=1971895 RepID=UPI0039E3C332
MSRFLPLALAVAAGLLLAGCASTGGIAPQGQLRDTASLQASRALADARISDAAWPDAQWWKALGDPQLDALIDEALASAPSLDAADARVRKAQAQAGLADAARKPTLGASGQYATAQLPEGLAGEEIGGKLMHNAMLMANFALPLDIWGGKRADYRAALGQARASEVDAHAARLALAANVARGYVALAQAFDALDIAQREQARSERLHALGKQRVDAGIDNRISLRNAETLIATAKAQQHAAQQQIDALRNALAALVGQGPDRGLSIQRPQLLQAPAPALPAALPSELLGHRPDVVAARWRVEAAAQGIKSAQAKFKPSIDISALVGLAAVNFDDLFRSDSLLGFGGPAISLPIFDGGQLRNNLAARDADYDLAVADYNSTVIAGLHETTDAVQAIRALDAQATSLEQARAAAASAYELAGQRHRAGLGTQLDVLAAQKPLLQLEQQIAGVRAQRYVAAIDLNRALGGGLAVEAPAITASNPSQP